MTSNKIFNGLIIVLTAVLLFFQFKYKSISYFEANINYAYIKGAIFPLIALLYFFDSRAKKTIFMSLFFIFYSLSELLVFGLNLFPKMLPYILGNTFYVLSFLALIIEILLSVDILKMLKKNTFSLIVMLIFSSICLYYFHELRVSFSSQPNLFEFIYFISLLILLTIGVNKYLFVSNKRNMMLTIGVVIFVVAEMFMIVYYHVNKLEILLKLSHCILVVSFYFIYYQTTLESKDFNYIE